MQTILDDVVATVIEGDFEWDDERLCRTSTSMAFPFQKLPPSSQPLPLFTLTTVPAPTGWLWLEPRCAIEFFMSCMSSEAGAIASSVHDQRLEPNETSTSPETTHDPTS
jgi:hypothetical protein